MSGNKLQCPFGPTEKPRQKNGLLDCCILPHSKRSLLRMLAGKTYKPHETPLHHEV